MLQHLHSILKGGCWNEQSTKALQIFHSRSFIASYSCDVFSLLGGNIYCEGNCDIMKNTYWWWWYVSLLNKPPDFEGEMKIILLQSVFPPADLPSYDSPPSFLFFIVWCELFHDLRRQFISTPSSLQTFDIFSLQREEKILFYMLCFCCCRRTSVWLENFVGKVGADRKYTHIHTQKHWCDAVCSCRVQWTFLKQ